MAYNQSANNQNVRVGNWYEELRLQEVTGIRYFPDPKNKKAGAITGARCFVHTEQTLPKDYRSTASSEYPDPKSRPEAGWSLAGTGPRQRMKERELRGKSDTTYDSERLKELKESMIVDYRSEATIKLGKADFVPSLRDKDPNMRYFTNHASYLFEKPITVYSDLVEKGGNMSFPCSFVCSSHPFRKNNLFTIDPRTSVKQQAECYEHPQALPTAGDYQRLQNLKSRLINHVCSMLQTDAGRSVRAIITAMWSSPSENDLCISIAELCSCISDTFGFDFSPIEQKSICSSFDCRGSISLIEFCLFLRPIPNLRRLELIHAAFNYLDKENNLYIARSTIESEFKSEGLGSFLDDIGAIHMSSTYLMTPASPSRPCTNRASTASVTQFTKNDFLDYYCDVSAEIMEDLKFEQILLSTWGLK